MPRVAFKTVGCRLNQAETAKIAGAFLSAGYTIVPFGGPCDVCVIHTCAVTERAVKDAVRAARASRRSEQPPRVVLAGCAVQACPEALDPHPGGDLLVGQVDKFRLPEILAAGKGPNKYTRQAPVPLGEDGVVPHFSTTRALLKAQDGCDFSCAYCIVPFARGQPTSRPPRAIEEEAKALADLGYREVVITGANLGAYHYGSARIVDLLEKIEAIPGILRTRISSIEISTTEQATIDYMAASSKLCHQLHLPLQSGDDYILSTMGRRYTAKQYRQFVEVAAEKVPFLGLGTDIIVGFPGESDAAFANTVAMVRDLPFSKLHVFPYSKRPRTRAATMPNHVDATIKKQRASRLITLGESKRRAFAGQFLGGHVSVLIEQADREGNGSGWTSEYLRARVRRPGLKVNEIVGFGPKRLDGETLA